MFLGALFGAFAGEQKVPAGATLSLIASIENKGRRAYSDLYRINVSDGTYLMCAETTDAGERMCSKGKIRIGRHEVDLFEQNFERFSGGVPISKGPSSAHWKFELVFVSDEAVVIYSPLAGIFALKKVI
jgi:hypothetical protein